ncbi:hypothetical protein L9F63_027040, partial [Diploptera punctata]
STPKWRALLNVKNREVEKSAMAAHEKIYIKKKKNRAHSIACRLASKHHCKLCNQARVKVRGECRLE